MHILYVSPVGERGGGEQVILTLAQRLRAQGHQATLALLQPGGLEKYAADAGVPVRVFPTPFRYRDLSAVRRSIGWLAEVIHETGADLVHANHTGHVCAGPACRRVGVPEVWHLYDYPHQWDIMDQVNRLIPASFMIYMTEYTRSAYPRLAARVPNEVVLPTCVDVAALRAAPVVPGVRERYGLGDAPYFLTLARLQEHKGHPDLLRAAARVAAERPDVVWVVAGKASGPVQEAYLRQLREQADAAGIAERVRFVGFVGDEDLPALMRGAAALVHPALTEGYGLTLIEAMALDTPVIATAATGPREILASGDNGLLVPVSDDAALAGAMTKVLDDPDLAARLRASGADYAARHSVDTMVEQTRGIYERVLAGRTAAGGRGR